jgi:transposase
MVLRTLTDRQWERLEPLLPPQRSGRGRPNQDHRLVIDGILWRSRTGAPWRALPPEFGPWETSYSRLRRWQQAGIWHRILTALQEVADADGVIDWTLHCLDSTTMRAHQHAAGGKKGAITPWDAARAGSAPNSTSVGTKAASSLPGR